MLSERRRKVLNALIEEYIETASPVSSRAIAGNHSLGVSSATVRNELYVLEEDGYVISPHVSSGRIPTDAGYRSFVDELLESIPEDDEEEQTEVDDQLASELQDSADELDDLLKQTSKALNRFTNCLAVVMSPRASNVTLKKISLVPLDTSHVVAVVVLEDGKVVSTVVEFEEAHSPEEVSALEALVSRIYEIRGAFDPLEQETPEMHPEIGDMAAGKDLQTIVEAIDDELYDEESTTVHFDGVGNLFSQPEMQQMSLAMGFAHLMDDDLSMFKLLGNFVSMHGLAVRIGHENQDESMNDISVVASNYGTDDRKGTVAVIGPTRMDYGKIIDAVRFASGYLDSNMNGKEG